MTAVGSQVRHAWDDRSAPITGRVVSGLDSDRWLVRWDAPYGMLAAVRVDDVVDLGAGQAAPPPQE